MLIYILKSVACMAIFFVFYKLLLEKENMHVFKRFYLLLAIGASIVIPTIVFTEYVVGKPIVATEIVQPVLTDYDYIGVPAALEEDVLDIEPILWTVYFFGLIFFGLKFIKNLTQVVKRIRKNPKQKSASFIQVLLQENFPPHTFFKYIFLNRKKLESNEIPTEVLLHEETHAKQKHSIDVIFIELLQVAFWFNPLVYLFKKAIKLNHEFLADQAVLDKDIDKNTYQNTLLSYLSPDSENKYQSKMANAINYSSIKKRFTVMKTHTSKKAMLFRSLLLLPLLMLLVVGFSETKFIQTEAGSSNVVIESLEQQRVTSEQLAKYNVLAKNYNKQPKETRVVPLEHLKILEDIYGEMSKEQKENAQPFPECELGAEIIQIEIDKKGIIRSKGSSVTIKSLPKVLKKYNSELSKEEREKSVRAIIKVSKNTPKSIINQVEQILIDYGVAQIDIKGPKINSSTQDGASREQMAEFNKLAKYYNEMSEFNMRIEKKDVDRLEYIYGLMSDKQKADAEPFPDFPEPPAPPQAPKEPELTERKEAARIIKKTIEEQDPYDVVGENVFLTQPPAPKEPKAVKAPKVKKGEKSDIPPPPPTAPEPVEPIDHVIEMAKKGATFYYEGEKVSSDKAIELLKKNKDLNIQSSGSNSKKPTVKITKAPIYLDRSKAPASLETGNIEINGKEGFYSIKNGETSYFNSKGQNVDRSGALLTGNYRKNPKIYFNGKKISSVKANQLLSNNSSIKMASKGYNDGSYAIILTDLNSPSSKNVNKNNNPNSAIDLTEMISKDALFFHNDKPISTEKALWLTQNSLIDRVNTLTPKKGKPKVYFWDKV